MSNPLIGAPHVPKRFAPEWGQFISDAGTAPGATRQGAAKQRSSVWSQARSNPYLNSPQPQQQQKQQKQQRDDGPLAPAWLQQQQEEDQQEQPLPPTHQQPLQEQLPAHQPHNKNRPSAAGAQQPVDRHTMHRGAVAAEPPPTNTGGSSWTAKTTTPPAQHTAGQGAAAAAAAGISAAFTPAPAAQHNRLHQQQQPGWQQDLGGQQQRRGQQQPAAANHSAAPHTPWRQQQQQQQPATVSAQRQQMASVLRPTPPKLLWELDEDVQLDMLDDSMWAAAGGASGAAAAGGGANRSCRTSSNSGMPAGQQLSHQAQLQLSAPQLPTWQQQQQHQVGQQPPYMMQHQAQAPGMQHQQPQMQYHPQPQHQQQQQHPQNAAQQPYQPTGQQPDAVPWQQQQQHHQQQQQQHHQQQQQQRVDLPAPDQQQQQHHKRNAAASKWSGGGTSLASLSRVPAAVGSGPISGGGWGGSRSLAGQQGPGVPAAAAKVAAAAGDTGSRGAATARSSSSLAAAAGGSDGSAADAVLTKGQGAKKAVRKGSKGAKGKAAAASNSNAGVSMEFVPRQAGEAPAQQPKLHQSTLFDSLKRANRNKQQQQDGDDVMNNDEQQDYVQQQQQQEDGVGASVQQRQAAAAGGGGGGGGFGALPGGSNSGQQQQPPAPPVVAAASRKRRHSSSSAAAAAGGPRSGGGASGVGVSGGRGKSGGGGGGRRVSKVAKMSAKTAAALEAAVEELDTWTLDNSNNSNGAQCLILDASQPGTAAWQQLQSALASAEGVALGVLYSRAVLTADAVPLALQYYSSLQPPYKQQQVLLSKAATVVKRQAGKEAAAADAEQGAQQDATDAAGVQQVVGLAVMPVTTTRTTTTTITGGAGVGLLQQQRSSFPAVAAAAAAAAAGGGSNGGRGSMAAAASEPLRPMYYISLDEEEPQAAPPHVLQLLQAIVAGAGRRPCVCCSAKAVLCSLANLGLALPAAGRTNLIDPELLGWLLDPQLIQDTKQESCYTLEQQLSRQRMQAAGVEALGPIQRLHHQLQQSLTLTRLLHTQLDRPGGVHAQAINLEMQAVCILAKMEVAGVACAPSVLSDHRSTLAARLAAIKARAVQLIGYDVNLSSSSQLAKVLYEDLRLTPPAGGGGRGAAKTHLSTNEATLKQLASSHELPGLVLEHRCIINVMSKWIDASWVQQAAQSPGGRVHCTWQQACTATGRLSSCSPNLQAVTKYNITASQDNTDPSAAAAAAAGSSSSSSPLLTINVRDAFVAPFGKLLLSADYSQIELRLLAHFSEDQVLRQILSQSTGDVFTLIAAALQNAGGRQATFFAAPGGVQPAAAPQVSPQERDRAKRVVYGIVYGQTPYGLAQQLADQGVTTAAAQGLIDSFLTRFPGVRQFMSRSISAAHGSGAVSTLMGRRRPIPGLSGDFQERQAAERKVVNSQIQGSAADLIKMAMARWDEWAAKQQQHAQAQAGGALQQADPGARLIAQIHDELVFEVNAPDAVMGPDGSLQHPGQQFVRVAAAVKQVMEGAAPMSVPLRAKLAWGTSWGSLADLQL